MSDFDWSPDFEGERYRSRRLAGCFMSAGSNATTWRGPRAPWRLSVNCTRAEAERLAGLLGGEAKGLGILDESWCYEARGEGADQADAESLAETLCERAVRLIAEWRVCP